MTAKPDLRRGSDSRPGTICFLPAKEKLSATAFTPFRRCEAQSGIWTGKPFQLSEDAENDS
jgi:hypothetical protein